MPTIQLMGGEKDGHVQTLPAKTIVPDLFYAVPNTDDPELRVLKGREFADRAKELAVLAYKLRSDEPRVNDEGQAQYLYDRYPEADIVRKSDA